MHSSAQADNEDKKKVRQTAINFIQKNGKEGFLKTLIPKLYGSLSDYQIEKAQHLKMAMQYTNEQIIACYAAMMNRLDRKNVLTNSSFPIQFIGGKEDQSIDYNNLISQSELCQQSDLHVYEGIGHTSMNENPKILLASIIGFTDDILKTI